MDGSSKLRTDRHCHSPGSQTIPLAFTVLSEKHLRKDYETVRVAKFTVTTSSGVFVVEPSEAEWNSMRIVWAFTTTRR